MVAGEPNLKIDENCDSHGTFQAFSEKILPYKAL